MATVTHTIHSHYDTQDRAILEELTGQTHEDSADDVWQAEAAFLARQHPPPRFVPATLATDEWGSVAPGSQLPSTSGESSKSSGSNVATWYRSLNRTSSPNAPTASSAPICVKSTSSTPGLYSQNHARPCSSSRGKEKRKDWFIMNAIQDEPARPSSAPPSTLADILSRHPPPLPSDPQFRPPVWLALGPSNKGFAMLQQSGWNEGEPLGPDVIRQRKVVDHIIQGADLFNDYNTRRKQKIKKEDMTSNSTQAVDAPTRLNEPEIIDLTISDSDESPSESEVEKDQEHGDEAEESEGVASPAPGVVAEDMPTDHLFKRTALLTPIATVLKADRLGIGLKAKTVGPYRASQKRITHNAAALVAHRRAAEALRRQKRRFGRGRCGFERVNTIESESRQQMLRYMNI